MQNVAVGTRKELRYLKPSCRRQFAKQILSKRDCSSIVLALSFLPINTSTEELLKWVSSRSKCSRFEAEKEDWSRPCVSRPVTSALAKALDIWICSRPEIEFKAYFDLPYARSVLRLNPIFFCSVCNPSVISSWNMRGFGVKVLFRPSLGKLWRAAVISFSLTWYNFWFRDYRVTVVPNNTHLLRVWTCLPEKQSSIFGWACSSAVSMWKRMKVRRSCHDQQRK